MLIDFGREVQFGEFLAIISRGFTISKNPLTIYDATLSTLCDLPYCHRYPSITTTNKMASNNVGLVLNITESDVTKKEVLKFVKDDCGSAKEKAVLIRLLNTRRDKSLHIVRVDSVEERKTLRL